MFSTVTFRQTWVHAADYGDEELRSSLETVFDNLQQIRVSTNCILARQEASYTRTQASTSPPTPNYAGVSRLSLPRWQLALGWSREGRLTGRPGHPGAGDRFDTSAAGGKLQRWIRTRLADPSWT
ncbi:hypothetical protein MY3296_000247 [Beauveria thailandica]